MEKSMSKRLVLLFCLILLTAGLLITRQLSLVLRQDYVAASTSQRTYRVEAASTRGRIYDREMRSLAGGRTAYKAVIAPSQSTMTHLMRVMEPEELAKMDSLLTGHSPFVWNVSDGSAEGDGVTVVTGETRYSPTPIAPHIVGYLGPDGHGVSGIELACDDILSAAVGYITLSYTVDAAGGSIRGLEPEIYDTTYLSRAGVVLTIDYDLQIKLEDIADNMLERGAIVLMNVKTGEIHAAVSRPDFRQDKVGDYLDSADSPLFNRITAAYDVGSVFKLVVAAAALEAGIPPDRSYCCEGCTDVGGTVFNCSNRAGHGEVDMAQAVALSCNTYFIDLAQELGGERILAMAEKLGFGGSFMLAENYRTASGVLPKASQLASPAALANLSFGQGKLSATPVHLASLISAIASGGIMREPALMVGQCDCDGSITPSERGREERVMSEETAQMLGRFMRLAVTDGTAKAGEGNASFVAAKTGTAQTGIVEDGRTILQAWYAGFFPYEKPEWACVVLAENGEAGSTSAAPVFKAVVDAIS